MSGKGKKVRWEKVECKWRPRSRTYCFGTTSERERDRERERERDRRREYDERDRCSRRERDPMTGDTQSAVTQDLSRARL